jgi:hypothetical protein
MDFDQHKQHLADQYAAMVQKHHDLPAVKQAIWARVKSLAADPAMDGMYKDLPDMLTAAVKQRAELCK